MIPTQFYTTWVLDALVIGRSSAPHRTSVLDARRNWFENTWLIANKSGRFHFFSLIDIR